MSIALLHAPCKYAHVKASQGSCVQLATLLQAQEGHAEDEQTSGARMLTDGEGGADEGNGAEAKGSPKRLENDPPYS